jgi:hypothetical protein
VCEGHEHVVVASTPTAEIDLRIAGRTPSSWIAWSTRWLPRSHSSSALRRRAAPLGVCSAPPLEPRLEPDHAAERVLLDKPAESEEVAIPPPVLEHAQQETALGG